MGVGDEDDVNTIYDEKQGFHFWSHSDHAALWYGREIRARTLIS